MERDRRAFLECGGKCSATPLLAERAASRLRVASALQNFFLLKTLSKTGADGYFQPRGAKASNLKKEIYRTVLKQKI